MSHVPKNYYQALATMIGYIIGVGMFGLPYIVAQSGYVTFLFWLIFIGFVQYFIHLIYANVIIATKEYHRLPGYTELYLGKPGKYFVVAAKFFGNFGALLAYIIITGIFLEQILAPYFGGSVFFYSTAMFAFEALIVYFGIKAIAKAEVFMTFLLILVVGLISWKGLGVINLDNYEIINISKFLLPYGVVLLAIDGGGSLPIVIKLLKRDKKAVKSVIRFGTLISALIILVFVTVIVGISGNQTSPDALSGVKAVLNDGVIFFSLIFGILTMMTSFFGVAESIKETLNWDFKVNKTLSWALAVFLPYSFYLLKFEDLSEILGVIGSLGGGFCGIVLMLIFLKMRKKRGALPLFDGHKPGRLAVSFFILIFLSGIIYQILEVIK